MRIGKRWVAGLFAASLLLPVPAFAIQKSVVMARGQVTIKQTGSSATQVIFHQSGERRTYVAFSRAIRTEFRRSGPFLKASAERYLRDLLLDLRDHWRVERRTGVVSPFDFPDL
jgi:hypothetical protein